MTPNTGAEMGAQDQARAEAAAETFAEAMEEARIGLLEAVATREIERLQSEHPELSHDEVDACAGAFLLLVADRVTEMQAARAKLFHARGGRA